MRFSDIIGQNSATVQLQRAYTNGRLSHAYIFDGPDGVGKRATAQALAALLDNAVKYSAGGTDIRLTAEKQGRFAVVAVADSGPDIPADKLPHIFDRFYRADEARTDGDSFGLGLPIAKAIIDAHRGTLRCESGGGVTRFIITLPLAAGKQERGTDHA